MFLNMIQQPEDAPRGILPRLLGAVALGGLLVSGVLLVPGAQAEDRSYAQGSLGDPGGDAGGVGGGVSGGGAGGGSGGLTNDSSGGSGDTAGGGTRLGVLIPIGDDGSGRPLEERVPEIIASLNPAQLMLVRSHCWSLYSAARNWTGDLRVFCSEVIDRD